MGDVVFTARNTDMTFATATLPTSLLMPHGQDIDLFQTPSELTIAQAAKMLDSREGLIHELIKDGEFDSRMVNGELMVVRDSFLDYKRERDRKDASLAEMVRWEQEMGLYDVEFDLEEYNATRNAIRNADRCS